MKVKATVKRIVGRNRVLKGLRVQFHTNSQEEFDAVQHFVDAQCRTTR